MPLVVEADQEPGTDAHQLPENEHHRQIAGDQDAHHRKAEQRQGLKESREPAGPVEVMTVRERHLVVGDVVQFVMHVPRRVDVDAGGDERDQHEHQDRERIDVPADRKFEPPSLVERVPVAGIGHRGVNPLIVMAGGSAAVPRRLAMVAGIGVAGGSMIAGVGGTVIAAMMHGRHGVRPQPRNERHQRKDQRRHNRGRRHPGRVAAVRSHLRAEEQDQHERRQRQKPGDSEELRELGGEIHDSGTGPSAYPLRSSARSTSTVAWLL